MAETTSIARKGRGVWERTPEYRARLAAAYVCTPEMRIKMIVARARSQVRHPWWKGHNASYGVKHQWLKRHFGFPHKCEHCGTEDKPLDWANVSGNYYRLRMDWKRLCRSCHFKFDYALGRGALRSLERKRHE